MSSVWMWKQNLSNPPSSGRLFGHWPACAICVSHWGDMKCRALVCLSLVISSPACSHQWKQTETLGKLFLYPDDFYLFPFTNSLLYEISNSAFFWGEIRWPLGWLWFTINASLFHYLFQIQSFCFLKVFFPSSDLLLYNFLLTHHPV